MPSILSKVFKGKDGSGASTKSKKAAAQNHAQASAPQKPQWDDAWSRSDVHPEEVQELLRGCTQEMKSRALDTPFLLLPFRPDSDPSAARTFIRNFFNQVAGKAELRGGQLQHELRLTDPMVICSVMKWCWSRLPGGVVSWEAYELFRVGEQDSNMARDAFAAFIPISVDSDARTKIIFDFFDLISAIAAHGKSNGLGGRKLSRLAGWWAFEHSDSGNGFDGGYKSWASAADATSHLFFAYLRSLSPDTVRGTNGISQLPISLQTLLDSTEYPPQAPTLQSPTTKVVMIVDSVSPTPFALLRRAKNFEYRDDDEILQRFAEYDDPVKALTDECTRVLKCISSTNQSLISSTKASTSLPDASWSRFEDIGFSGIMEESDQDDDMNGSALSRRHRHEGLSSKPNSRMQDFGRPTTPSWADFLSSGFADEAGDRAPAPLLLPPDKILPPIDTSRVHSSQSHRRNAQHEANLEPGELASINSMDMDDAFWWVWITSLAGEEPTERKAVFGRCALIETSFSGSRWILLEEKVRGAAPAPDEGIYIAEKKSRFGFTKRGRLTRRKSTGKNSLAVPHEPYSRTNQSTPVSKTSIGPDQHARIQAAAAALQQKQKHQDLESAGMRRARAEDGTHSKTNSVFTLQPVIMNEAAPAMKWAKNFDKDAIRAAYLGNNYAGRGQSAEALGMAGMTSNGAATNGTAAQKRAPAAKERDLPAIPKDEPVDEQPKIDARPVTPPPPPVDVSNKNTMGNGAAEDAALVPLPSPRQVERKRLPRADHAPVQPINGLSRTLSPEQNLAASAAKAAWQSKQTTPEKPEPLRTPEKNANANKLRKSPPGNGFKKLFGRKKAELPSRSITPQPDGSASLQVPQEQSALGKRFSSLRRKPSPTPPPITTEPVPQAEPQLEVSAVEDYASTAAPEEAALTHQGSARDVSHDSRPTSSHVDTLEQADAEKAFQTFDQGPLDDVPAFVPEDSPEGSTPIGASPEAITPAEQDSVAEDASRTSDELTRQTSSPAQDRWAQIRKNAADRASRQSEEQSRPSQSARTDDGETSGEETIESRVARIKARVAELTGNLDGRPAERA
ncbi:MAG: hypothetical protein M1819_001866 [Sarea resinae]|nr:MAG: hypothetical protein M1819_001866 [Sarea resinae]